jgi:hypothetical protein
MVKHQASNVDKSSVVAEAVYPVFVTAWYEFPAGSFYCTTYLDRAQSIHREI